MNVWGDQPGGWDFGDDTESNMASPSHVYPQAGTYTVRLTVKDQSGDSDYFERSLKVIAN